MSNGAIAFFVTAITVPCLVFFSRTFKVYDRLDARKIHTGNVSRLGGVGIFTGFFSVTCFLLFTARTLSFNKYIYLSAMILAFAIGLIDDIKRLRARHKLVLQTITGLLVAWSGLQVQQLSLLNWLNIDSVFVEWIITAFWVVAFMNAINLIDGLDGLASGIVIIASIFLCTIAYYLKNPLVMQLSLILTGSTLGFYLYNFPYGRIFMGDSGAYLLGFIYATLPLMGINKSSAATVLIVPILMLIFPLWDIGRVIWLRMKKGVHIFTPDNSHIHHRLLEIGFSKKEILLVLYAYTIILGICSIIMIHIPVQYTFLLFSAIFLLVALSFFVIDTVENIQKTKKKKQRHSTKHSRVNAAQKKLQLLHGAKHNS